MRSIPTLLMILTSLAMTTTSAPAQVDGKISLSTAILDRAAHQFLLSGDWKFKPGDDPGWSSLMLDDSDWVAGRTNLDPDALPATGWPGTGWFRLRIQPDSTLVGRPLALAVKQFGATEVFLDGRLLLRYGRIDDSGLDSETDIDPGPKLLIANPGAEHLLAVRHVNRSADSLGRTGTKAGFSAWIGELVPAAEHRTRAVATSRILQYFSAGVLLVFAFFHLLMYLFYPTLGRNLYVSIFAGLLAALVYMNMELQFGVDLTSRTYIERLWRYGVVFATLSGAGICYSFLYLRLPRTFWIFLGIGIALATAASFRLHLLNWVYIFVMVVFADILRLIGLALSRRRRVVTRVIGRKQAWFWVISLGMGACIACATYQIAINLKLVPPPWGFEYPYLIGILLFLVPVSAGYLFYDFAQIHHRLHRANVDLERRVDERTRDLEEAVEEADAASQAKSRFLANVSHEIRTPMNAILGYAQVLQRSQDLSEPHRAAIETIHSSGDHLLNLLDDVLELSVIESGHLKLNPRDFDLTHLVEMVESMFADRCTRQGLQWQRGGPAAGALWVHGDEAKLTQVLVNLIGNAVKYTQSGTVTLEVETNGEEKYRFAINDTGPGISDTDLHGLYEPFEQGEAGNMRGGTGLGLAIAKHYVELMGGKLTVDSTPGTGSRFAFAVRLTPGQVRALASVEPGAGVQHLAEGHRIAVLVVDDNRENRDILCHLLGEIGAEVTAATGGREALDLLAAATAAGPDLVFMDIHMPDIDGVETLEGLRQLAGGEHCRVVAVSASALDVDRRRTLDAGFDAFIGKPFRFEQIYACLEELLGVEFIRSTPVSAAVDRDWSGLQLSSDLHERLQHAAANRQVTQMEHCFKELETLGTEGERLAKHLRTLRQQHRMEEIVSLMESIHAG